MYSIDSSINFLDEEAKLSLGASMMYGGKEVGCISLECRCLFLVHKQRLVVSSHMINSWSLLF